MGMQQQKNLLFIHFCYSVTRSTLEQTKAKQLLLVRTSNKYADKEGLLQELPATINLLYTLMINIKTNDGLINGTSCTLENTIPITDYKLETLYSIGLLC